MADTCDKHVDALYEYGAKRGHTSVQKGEVGMSTHTVHTTSLATQAFTVHSTYSVPSIHVAGVSKLSVTTVPGNSSPLLDSAGSRHTYGLKDK